MWAAVKPILLAAIGGRVVTLADGCSSLAPSAKTRFACDEVVKLPERESANPEGAESMSLYAIGIPGIAVVTQSEQTADNKGDDENKPAQSNPVTVDTRLK